jgi:hypothetical protein
MATTQTSTPILLHVHIPKTAGMSVRAALAEAFGDHHRDAYTGVQGSSFSERELAEIASGLPRTDAISSHSIHTIPESLNGRATISFCFVRDPLAQFLSYVRFVRQSFSELTQTHRSVLPAACDKLSQRDIASWLLEQPAPVPFSAAFITRFLTPGMDGYTDAERRQIALGKLRTFDYIGRSTCVDDSLEELEAICWVRGLKVKFPRGLRKNTTVRPSALPDWFEPGTRLRQDFETRFGADRELLSELGFSTLAPE